jgi:hypothetical protein
LPLEVLGISVAAWAINHHIHDETGGALDPLPDLLGQLLAAQREEVLGAGYDDYRLAI